MRFAAVGVLVWLTTGSMVQSDARQAVPVPEKLVVLTFDDSAKSHATYVAPLLNTLGFGAT
jgi:peptidoglycan/xylan/chitin deacetylase (PgdA/CDA1 family)